MKTNLWMIALAAMWLCTGCGDDSGPTGPSCVETLCETGTKLCVGNVAATCSTDGLAFSLNPCDGICESGSCIEKAIGCIHPGQSHCEGNNIRKCSDSGTAVSTKSCGDGQTCAAGQCNNIPCTPGATLCGWREVATCNKAGDGWDETSCGSGEICVDGACSAQACAPNTVTCVDEGHQQLCNDGGNSASKSSCGHGKYCYDTYGCQPKLCSLIPPPTPDVVEQDVPPPPEDTKPIIELEPLDDAEAVIDGEKVEFTSYQNAYYMEDDSDLRIIMDAGLKKIEISLKGLEEFDVGHWTSAQAGDVQVNIWYNDGTPLPEGAQWKFVSVDYDMELLKFQATGGRVKGIFSGSFTPDGGTTTIPFTDGYFDIERNN